MNNAQMIQKSPATAAGFELDNIDNNEQITHKVAFVEDDDGEPIVGFLIVGKNSAECQAAENANRIANIKRAGKRSTQIDSSTDDGAALVARTVASNDHTVALAVVVGWFGFNIEGAPATFDKAKVDTLLTKFPTWKAKVLNALEVDKNFIKV